MDIRTYFLERFEFFSFEITILQPQQASQSRLDTLNLIRILYFSLPSNLIHNIHHKHTFLPRHNVTLSFSLT